METVLRPLIVAASALAVTVAVAWVADRTLKRIAARRPETPLWQLLRRSRRPFQATLFTSLALLGYPATGVGQDHQQGIERSLTLAFIASLAWLLIQSSTAIVEAGYARFAATSQDIARVRRVRTQVTLIQRVVTAAIGVVAAAVMLMQFPPMRTVGTSVLASAGVIAAVAGIAAQSTLGNLLAGLQIAFGDLVRLGDTVVVAGEWGAVEEITLTYLVVRTWDERRITMPVSYFTGNPFENWSRGSAEMTGTVFLHLDHSAPIDLLRERLRRVLAECETWDGRGWGLLVTDTTPTTIVVRAMVTAKDGDDIWTLRCTVREKLLDWLLREHPYALPRISTAPAPGLTPAPGPTAGPGQAHGPQQAVQAAPAAPTEGRDQHGGRGPRFPG